MEFFSKIFVILLGLGLWKAYQMTQNPPLPTLEKNPWWGPGQKGQDNPAIRPFKINIPKADIDDLNARLSLPLCLTPPLENANFTYGFNSDVLKKVLDYWKTDYNWKKRENRLNSFPQFITQVEGIDIHFIRVKPNLSASPSTPVTVKPLLMIHGWPGSVVEFDEIIPLLTTPRDGLAFEVICPSLPGYGFSQASSKQGLGPLETSQIFLKLMKRLGFDQFYVQGGDWGSLIASTMATLFPKNVTGMHSNMVIVNTLGTNLKYILGSILPSGLMIKKEDEKNMFPISSFYSFLLRETGYLHIQATKPDTVGAALSNSPVGLLAYILEKFSSWTNKNNPSEPDGGLLKKDFPISMDRLLDNVSIYWFTRSITSSMRFYAESLGSTLRGKIDQITTNVPVGFSSFAQEIFNHPEYFAAHKYNFIVSYKKHDVGGHFAAMECPTILAEDIFEFVAEVERRLELMGKLEL